MCETFYINLFFLPFLITHFFKLFSVSSSWGLAEVELEGASSAHRQAGHFCEFFNFLFPLPGRGIVENTKEHRLWTCSRRFQVFLFFSQWVCFLSRKTKEGLQTACVKPFCLLGGGKTTFNVPKRHWRLSRGERQLIKAYLLDWVWIWWRSGSVVVFNFFFSFRGERGNAIFKHCS